MLLRKTLYITGVETGLTQLASAPWNTQIKCEVYIFAVDITQFPFVLSFCVLFFFFYRKSIKKLVLKNLNNSSLFSPVNRENEDLASPSEYPENGDRYGDGCCRSMAMTVPKLSLRM